MRAELTDRRMAGLCAGLAAAMIAHAAGVPWWNSRSPSDAVDIGLCIGLALYYALRALGMDEKG